MSQTEWQRRILLVTGREEELEATTLNPSLDALDVNRYMELYNVGIISRKALLKEIYGESNEESILERLLKEQEVYNV